MVDPCEVHYSSPVEIQLLLVAVEILPGIAQAHFKVTFGGIRIAPFLSDFWLAGMWP